jgi:hypothetical protein
MRTDKRPWHERQQQAARDELRARIAARGDGEMRQQERERDRWADDGGAP